MMNIRNLECGDCRTGFLRYRRGQVAGLNKLHWESCGQIDFWIVKGDLKSILQ